MPLSSQEKIDIVTAVCQRHVPWRGTGTDSRNLATLKTAFLTKALDQAVRSYQQEQADASIEVIDSSTVN